jgi:hypothetical protein
MMNSSKEIRITELQERIRRLQDEIRDRDLSDRSDFPLGKTTGDDRKKYETHQATKRDPAEKSLYIRKPGEYEVAKDPKKAGKKGVGRKPGGTRNNHEYEELHSLPFINKLKIERPENAAISLPGPSKEKKDMRIS